MPPRLPSCLYNDGTDMVGANEAVDVIVIGAGPAGSVTAALLGRLGYSVEIWETLAFPRFRLGESLPPRAVALLGHLGFGDVVSAEGFAVMEGHTSVWSDGEPRRAVFESGAGLQVERSRFDQVLLDACRARVRMRRTATGLIREDGRVSGATFVEGGREGQSRAAMVVVAAGPRSRFGRCTGPRTTHLKQWGIVGYWKDSTHPEGSQMNDTIIESFSDGWFWSLRLASDLRNATVLFGEDQLERVRQGIEPFYQAALASTSFTKGLLGGAASLSARPIGIDGAWLCAERFSEPGLLLVGDAGSVIDPLSSQGVYKAMCSATTAVAVINTCLRKPELEPVALEYFDEEEHRMFDGYAAGAVSTFRREQRWKDRPFWAERHSLSTGAIPDTESGQPGPVMFPPELAVSIEAGRAGHVLLTVEEGVSIEARPFIADNEIVLSDCLVTKAFPYGYRGPQHELLVELVRAFDRGKPIGNVVDTKKNRPSSDVLRTISYLCREGLFRQIV